MIVWKRDKKCNFDGFDKDTGIVFKVSEMKDYRVIYCWLHHWLFVGQQYLNTVEECKTCCENEITPLLLAYTKDTDFKNIALGAFVIKFNPKLSLERYESYAERM